MLQQLSVSYIAYVKHKIAQRFKNARSHSPLRSPPFLRVLPSLPHHPASQWYGAEFLSYCNTICRALQGLPPPTPLTQLDHICCCTGNGESILLSHCNCMVSLLTPCHTIAPPDPTWPRAEHWELDTTQYLWENPWQSFGQLSPDPIWPSAPAMYVFKTTMPM